MNRRDFIKSKSAALIALSGMPAYAEQLADTRKRVGLIGTGWYGGYRSPAVDPGGAGRRRIGGTLGMFARPLSALLRSRWTRCGEMPRRPAASRRDEDRRRDVTSRSPVAGPAGRGTRTSHCWSCPPSRAGPAPPLNPARTWRERRPDTLHSFPWRSLPVHGSARTKSCPARLRR